MDGFIARIGSSKIIFTINFKDLLNEVSGREKVSKALKRRQILSPVELNGHKINSILTRC